MDGGYFVRSAARVFAENEYVVKVGVVYRIKYDDSGGTAYASYLIRATEEDPGDDATVVQFGSLSQEAQAPVERAIQNGSHGVPPGKRDPLPQDISDADFVEYNGTTYRLSVVYGDEFAGVLRVEKVE